MAGVVHTAPRREFPQGGSEREEGNPSAQHESSWLRPKIAESSEAPKTKPLCEVKLRKGMARRNGSRAAAARGVPGAPVGATLGSWPSRGRPWCSGCAPRSADQTPWFPPYSGRRRKGTTHALNPKTSRKASAQDCL